MNDSVKKLFQYLQLNNLTVDYDEFKFQILSHPNYPSLAAFSDTLNFFNVENAVFKVEDNHLEDLPDQFLTLVNKPTYHGSFALEPVLSIVKKKESNIYIDDILVSKAEFREVWKKVVLLVEKPVEASLANGKKSNVQIVLLSLLIISVILSVYFSNSYYLGLVGITNILGIIFSLEALKVELGINSNISQKICNYIPNSDCDQVINSLNNRWIDKIKFSDLSFWFFVSQLFALLFFSVAGKYQVFFLYLFLTLMIAGTSTIYSLYVQYFVEKKWCGICLLITCVIYTQLLLLSSFTYKIVFEIKSISLFTFCFLIVACMVYLIKPIFKDKKELQENYMNQLRFIKNYEIFKNSLLMSETKSFIHKNIVLGNKESEHEISIITSPFCGFCKETHQIVSRILRMYSNKIAISIRFNFYEDLNEKNKFFVGRLIEIYDKQGEEQFIKSLDDWFENQNIDNWILKYGHSINNEHYLSYQKIVSMENIENGLNFTPVIFLNQYKFPNYYDKNHLEYYISDWLEDEEL